MNKVLKKNLTIFIISLFSIFYGCNSDEPDNNFNPTLSQIELSKPANKIIYHKGDALDTTGLEVTAVYRSGATRVVTGWTVVGFDSSMDVASQNLTIIYVENGISRFTQYTIQYSNLSGLSVTTPPRKTKYRVGDYAGIKIGDQYPYKNRDFINLADLVLTVSRTNGENEIIDFSKIDSDVLVKDDSGRIMIEFLNSGDMSTPCKKYYDIPKTKTIDLGDNKSLVFSGFAFIKEEENPQINIEYTEKCGDSFVTRSASFGISLNYTPAYEFTEEPQKVDNKDAYYFGDYPQSEIKSDENIIICKKSMDRGLFKYYVGSDGNYYIEEFGTYFKVEPILWKKHDSYGLKRGYIADVALDGNVIYSPLRGTSYLRDEQKTETVTEEGTEQGTQYYNYTTYYYTLHYHPGNYQKSVLSDFLNGTTASGLGTYSGKGFYQTAFTGKAQEYLAATAFKEQIAYDYVKIRTYTDGTKGYAENNYGWTSFGSFSQMVSIPDFCADQDVLDENYVGYKKGASEYAKKKIYVGSNGYCKYMIREIYSTDPNNWGYEMIQHSSDYVLYCDDDGEWAHYDGEVHHLNSEDVYNSYDLGIVPWIMFSSIE